MKKTTIYCDICKSDTDVKEANMQVIFTTEQTEGRSTNPYFELINLDMCPKCYAICLSGNYIFASGAQGYNTYNFI